MDAMAGTGSSVPGGRTPRGNIPCGGAFCGGFPVVGVNTTFFQVVESRGDSKTRGAYGSETLSFGGWCCIVLCYKVMILH